MSESLCKSHELLTVTEYHCKSLSKVPPMFTNQILNADIGVNNAWQKGQHGPTKGLAIIRTAGCRNVTNPKMPPVHLGHRLSPVCFRTLKWHHKL